MELFSVQQEEPLWRIQLTPEELQKSLNLFVQELNFRIREIEEYGSNHPLQLLLYGLLTIVMLSLTYWSRSTVKEHEELYRDNADREMSSLDTMASPLSYGLLLTLILIVMIHAIRIDLPYGFRMVLYFLLMLVWLFVLSRVLSRGLHAPIYGLAALLVIDIVRGSPRELQLITRLILTVELTLSLVGALWVLRSGYFNKIGLFFERKIWLRVLKGWHLLNVALLSVGLAAVFSGYLILADRLARLVILEILVGTTLMVSVRLIETIVRSALIVGLFNSVHTIKNNRELFLSLVRRIMRIFVFSVFIYAFLLYIALCALCQDICYTF